MRRWSWLDEIIYHLQRVRVLLRDAKKKKERKKTRTPQLAPDDHTGKLSPGRKVQFGSFSADKSS